MIPRNDEEAPHEVLALSPACMLLPRIFDRMFAIVSLTYDTEETGLLYRFCAISLVSVEKNRDKLIFFLIFRKTIGLYRALIHRACSPTLREN